MNNSPESAEPSTPDVTSRATYPVWGRETVRYADTDAHGHVNNVSYAAYFETGRTTLVRAAHLPIGPQAPARPVLARIEIDYRAEVHWPAELDIGIAVVKLGRSSMTLIQGLFIGEACVATAREVLVLVETATGRSTPLPEEMRLRLTALGGPGAGTVGWASPHATRPPTLEPSPNALKPIQGMA
jgi:acyl-CoA thioester hydrolase